MLQPWGEAVFTSLAKRKEKKYTKQEMANKLRKWNESCWKGVVYIIFSLTAFLVTFREPYFTNPDEYWTGATQYPLNYHVPFKTTLFYLIEIGFYLQVCACRFVVCASLVSVVCLFDHVQLSWLWSGGSCSMRCAPYHTFLDNLCCLCSVFDLHACHLNPPRPFPSCSWRRFSARTGQSHWHTTS